MTEPKFASTIQEWLLYTHNAATPVAPKELSAFIRARTGLSSQQCKLIISGLFQEIVGIILEEKRFALNDFGEIFISKKGRLFWGASIRFKNKINEIFREK